ncbi:MAG: hypothetical protein ACREMY_08640, partial [bacterium]
LTAVALAVSTSTQSAANFYHAAPAIELVAATKQQGAATSETELCAERVRDANILTLAPL